MFDTDGGLSYLLWFKSHKDTNVDGEIVKESYRCKNCIFATIVDCLFHEVQSQSGLYVMFDTDGGLSYLM